MLRATSTYDVRCWYDEDNDEWERDRHLMRWIEMVLRWHPPAADRVENRRGGDREAENPPGIRALHQLHDGGAVNLSQLEEIGAYLREAIVHYTQSEEPEPYPGRDAEAVDDFGILLEIVDDAISVAEKPRLVGAANG